MRLSKLLIPSLLLILFFNTGILATNFYIDAIAGNDNNNGTSQTSAWKTLAKLDQSWDMIKAGDNVLLKRGSVFKPNSIPTGRNGIIVIPTNKMGSSSAYITIGSYGTGEKPIVSAENTSATINAFLTRSAAYFIIQDIEFRGRVYVYSDFNYIGNHHLKFLRLTLLNSKILVHHSYAEISPEVYKMSPLHNIEIGYCEIYNSPDGGINFKSSSEGNHWIHNNKIFNAKTTGINIGGGNNTIIEYNLVTGSGSHGAKFKLKREH
jgi:hypothetical protein